MIIALIAGLPATLSVVLAYKIRQQIKTPSGQKIGELAERGTHLAEVNTVLTADIHRRVGATGHGIPTQTPQPKEG